MADQTRIGPEVPNSHTSGPFADDRTTVGGVEGSQNTDPDPVPDSPRKRSRRRASEERDYRDPEQPVTRDSPWKLHVPAWRTMVLGGSGGIYRGEHTHLEG